MRRVLVTPWRRLVQLASFLLTAPWLAVGILQCPHGVPFVSCLSCPVTTCRGTWLLLPMLTVLGVSQLLLARAFCGWLCPLGFIQDGLAALVGRWWRWRSGGGVDRAARAIKYALLAWVVVWVFVVAVSDDRAYDYVVRSPRWVDVEAARVAGAMGLARYPVRWLLLAIGLMGSLVLARFWCRYLCPLGAALALVRPLSVRSLERDTAHCGTCSLCASRCGMGTTPGSPECTSCYDCADTCPAGSIQAYWRWPWRRSRRQPETTLVSLPGAATAAQGVLGKVTTDR